MIKAQSETTTTIELTPIIDMVFLLLIFFLVASTFQQTEREMQIALPSAASAAPISTAMRELIINIDAQGRIFVNGNELQVGALEALIQNSVDANPDQKVTVRGDKNTAYSNIVRVLDACKGSGIQEPYLDTVIEQ